MNLEKNKWFLILLILSIVTGTFTGCSRGEKYIRMEGMIWNTTYHITYKGPEELKDSVLPVLNQVSQSVSVFEESSIVSRLNKSDSIKADLHFLTLYDASRRINELSKGSFDPTVSPLIDAWGFGKGHKVTGDTVAIDSILNFIGIEKTYRNGDWIIKNDKRTQFNFSAIAKGYGCDAVGKMFIRNGVENFMVEIGGELCLKGNSPSGKKWQIAVDAPTEDKNPGEEVGIILSLTDVGVATSGNYRNYREEGGRKIAHTISPKTGRPLLGDILSSTVIASTCMEADGIATACMASNLSDAKELLDKTGVEAMLILPDTIWETKGFSKFISGVEEP